MEIGQCLRVIERVDFRHDAEQQIQHTLGLGGENGKVVTPVPRPLRLGRFQQRALGAGRLIGRWHI